MYAKSLTPNQSNFLKMNTVQDDNRRLEDWIAAMAQSDKTALSELYLKTRSAVYGFALSILRNPQDAEDVLQDTYIRLYASAGSYRAQGKPMAFVLTIARNLSLMKLRQRGRAAELSDEGWAALPATGSMAPEERLLLQSCMNRLADTERQVVVLHAVAGLKHKEIAELMHLPLSTVLSKYNRAVGKLKSFYQEGE